MIYVRRLIWDAWNVAHIARHDVDPEEVEEVCHGEPLVRESYGGRLLLVGPSRLGRMLAVVLAPEEKGIYYPITPVRRVARSAATIWGR